MATSEARRIANVRNAQKSTGPRTEAGKQRSSMNALTHGLTAAEAVLPHEDPDAYQATLDQWLDFDNPTDPAHAAVIECCVSAKFRLDRCTRAENQRSAERTRHAQGRHDFEKRAEAEEIGSRLVFDPINRCEVAQLHDPIFQARIKKRLDDNPAVLTQQLQMTSQGVDWLIQRWLELAEMLKRHKFWHYPEKFRALWMLGKNPHDVYEDKVVQKIFLACNVAHPEVSDGDKEMLNLWDECYQAKMGIAGKPMYVLQLDNIRGLRPPDALTAQAQLWEVITGELNRLGELKKHFLDPLDRLDRDSAPDRAMFDDSKEGVLLRRYRTACEREFHKSIADLLKLRKAAALRPEPEAEEAPLRNEPIAEDEAGESVASSGPISPRFEPVATGPAAERDGLEAPIGPISAPCRPVPDTV